MRPNFEFGAISARNEDRAKTPITWIQTTDGRWEVCSRFGDDIYDFTGYVTNPAAHSRRLDLTSLPAAWSDSFRETLVAFWVFGRPSAAGPPKASTVIATGSSLLMFIKWLNRVGVTRFSQLQPIHAATYAQYIKTTPLPPRYGKLGQLRTPRSVEGALQSVSLAWDLRGYLRDAPLTSPWGDRGGQTKNSVSRGDRHRSKTYCLTEDEAKALFTASETMLKDSQRWIGIWEAVQQRRSSTPLTYRDPNDAERENKWLKKTHGISFRFLRWRLRDIRAAIAFRVGLLVGQRVSEILSLDMRCCVKREQGSEMLTYLRGKTYKGRDQGCEATEWLAPDSIADYVSMLERIRQAAEHRISLQLQALKSDKSEVVEPQLQRTLAEVVDGYNALFAKGIDTYGLVKRLHRTEFSALLNVVRERAGVRCKITPHVLRRTFAVNVVHSCNGDLRYLRQHFQHWSLETTALYASNPASDKTMLEEIALEISRSNVGTVKEWFKPETTLAGGAGNHIAAMRQRPEFRGSTIDDQEAIVRSLLAGFSVRDTGHSHCLFRDVPSCGGRGLYDPRECGTCSSAVITKREVPVWRQLAVHNQQIIEREDSGPAAIQVAQRSLMVIKAILQPFE